MTKKDFLERRARMDFEKKHGVTHCEPGVAQGIYTPAPMQNRRRHHPDAIGKTQRACVPDTNLSNYRTGYRFK